MSPNTSLFMAAATVAIFVVSTAWAITDARQRGRTGAGIVMMIALFGPFAAFMWLAMRPKMALLDRRTSDYDHPEDALAAASKLDALGEWEHAAVLYEHAAIHWPEHRPYVIQCLARLRRMQAL
jgi:hypothetical protein